MAHHLSSFPIEILCHIVDELDLDDVLSFAYSSRTMYDLSRPTIQRRKEDKYSMVKLGKGPDRSPGLHPLVFLDMLLRDPRIASYVKELQIAPCTSDAKEEEDGDDDDDDDDENETHLTNLLSTHGPELAALRADCPWLSEAARRRESQDTLVQWNDQLHYLALFLNMLPNLESMIMLGMPHDVDRFREMIGAIAATNDDPESPTYNRALSKLKKISLQDHPMDGEERYAIYAPFLALPSMRSIYGKWLLGGIDDEYVHAAANDVEEINFVNSAIDPGSWEWILGSIKDLKTFIYYNAPLELQPMVHNPFGIVTLLRRYAGPSLQRLGLTGFLPSFWDFYTEGRASIGDLTDFKTLQNLRLDDIAFHGPDEARVDRLVDMLPASIQEVRLVRMNPTPGDIAYLFVGLAEGKVEKLPKLEIVYLEGEYILDTDLIQRCGSVGVEISHIPLWFDI
ncbi:MAG: hypothetical protein L6R40_005456 [Gallowayella cf. fulva]|nr:MAG: hypothetical protein L6R40_005456 [Xanthomendoza cf. fulva]